MAIHVPRYYLFVDCARYLVLDVFMRDVITEKSIQTYLDRPLKEIWDLFIFTKKMCPVCLGVRHRLVRYNNQHPTHTDDTWHEFQCLDCQRRIGRWSGYFLGEKYIEKKGHYPVEPHKNPKRRDAGRNEYFNPNVGELPV